MAQARARGRGGAAGLVAAAAAAAEGATVVLLERADAPGGTAAWRICLVGIVLATFFIEDEPEPMVLLRPEAEYVD